jgi:hypothetical protein
MRFCFVAFDFLVADVEKSSMISDSDILISASSTLLTSSAWILDGLAGVQ